MAASGKGRTWKHGTIELTSRQAHSRACSHQWPHPARQRRCPRCHHYQLHGQEERPQRRRLEETRRIRVPPDQAHHDRRHSPAEAVAVGIAVAGDETGHRVAAKGMRREEEDRRSFAGVGHRSCECDAAATAADHVGVDIGRPGYNRHRSLLDLEVAIVGRRLCWSIRRMQIVAVTGPGSPGFAAGPSTPDSLPAAGPRCNSRARTFRTAMHFARVEVVGVFVRAGRKQAFLEASIELRAESGKNGQWSESS